MKALLLSVCTVFGLLSGAGAWAQLSADPTAEEQVLMQNSLIYLACLSQEFRKLTTPNFDDPDVFQLMKIADEDVFQIIKPGCATQRETLLAIMPGSQAYAKALEGWEADEARNYLRRAQRERTALAGKVIAIRVPGPRPAVPLVEAIFADDYPALAMRQEEQGRVMATYTVGANGRVLDCKGEGATETLHNAACAVIVRRWRYAPALDAAGQRVTEVRTKAINFSIN